jgi:hypothetical protein
MPYRASPMSAMRMPARIAAVCIATTTMRIDRNRASRARAGLRKVSNPCLYTMIGAHHCFTAFPSSSFSSSSSSCCCSSPSSQPPTSYDPPANQSSWSLRNSPCFCSSPLPSDPRLSLSQQHGNQLPVRVHLQVHHHWYVTWCTLCVCAIPHHNC